MIIVNEIFNIIFLKGENINHGDLGHYHSTHFDIKFYNVKDI